MEENENISDKEKSQTNINPLTEEQTVKVEVTALPKAKINYALIVAFISVLISLYSLFQSIVTREQTLQRMDANLKVSNKPIMLLSRDSTAIVLWNSGEGVAYDVNIETHLADNIGNVGVPWVLDVMQAAMELETKDKKQMFRDANWLNQDKLLTNPPSVFAKVIEYGYKTSYLGNSYAISGIFVIIRYSDGLGSKYFSVWDGYSWKFGEGDGTDLVPVYTNVNNPAVQFKGHLDDYSFIDSSESKPFYYTSPYKRWLKKEAEFNKLHNIGQSNNSPED